MRVVRYDEAAGFIARAKPFLMEREAEHNLLLGLGTTLLRSPEIYPCANYLATVEEGRQVVAVALRTPPHYVILSAVADPRSVAPACELLAEDVRAAFGTLPGVVGPVRESETFTQAWQRQTGQSVCRVKHERIFALEGVVPVAGVPGSMRRAEECDRPLLVRWLDEFQREAVPEDPPEDGERWVSQRLNSPVSGIFLWEADRRPVTMVGYGGPTPHGIRIGPVYTPPAHRGHGYASACTAAASQALLDEGRRFCFLYTNLANPTSNHIYQAIGYQPVADVRLHQFGAADDN